jgi:hypothetical protein
MRKEEEHAAKIDKTHPRRIVGGPSLLPRLADQRARRRTIAALLSQHWAALKAAPMTDRLRVVLLRFEGGLAIAPT